MYLEPEMSYWPRETLSPSTLSMTNICREAKNTHRHFIGSAPTYEGGIRYWWDWCEPTFVTHIWLVVRVPVLSEQMTEVQPRVSTEGRLLTMAFFLAIRRVPRARQVVMTAGRPAVEGTGGQAT